MGEEIRLSVKERAVIGLVGVALLALLAGDIYLLTLPEQRIDVLKGCGIGAAIAAKRLFQG